MPKEAKSVATKTGVNSMTSMKLGEWKLWVY